MPGSFLVQSRRFQIVARVFHSARSLSRVETRIIMKNLPNSFSYMYIGGEEDVLSLYLR